MAEDAAKASELVARKGEPTIPVTREQALINRQLLHGPGIASHVYAQQIEVVAADDELQETAFGHAADILRRLGCRDPLEGNACDAGTLGARLRRPALGDGEQPIIPRHPAGNQRRGRPGE